MKCRIAWMWIGLCAGAGGALCGCASPAQQAEHQEDLLAAAGFLQRPATTLERQHAMASLPPNQIVRTVHDDKVVYIYADPIVCNCLYIGSQEAWNKYQQERVQLRLAHDQVTAAELNQEAAMNWSWGPWGPGWW